MNPAGFWERAAINDINGRILRALGGDWRHPPSPAPCWERSDGLAELRKEARAVLEAAFEGSALWGWKDPRSCLTLPFWQRLVPEMRYVVCVRDPIAVAASARQALRLVDPPLSEAEAHELWMRYTAAALQHTSGCRRVLVSYDEYFRNTRAAIERLARVLGRRPPVAGSAEMKEIERTVDYRPSAPVA